MTGSQNLGAVPRPRKLKKLCVTSAAHQWNKQWGITVYELRRQEQRKRATTRAYNQRRALRADPSSILF